MSDIDKSAEQKARDLLEDMNYDTEHLCNGDLVKLANIINNQRDSDIDNRDNLEYQMSELRRAVEMDLNRQKNDDFTKHPIFIGTFFMAVVGFATFLGWILAMILYG